MCDIERPLCAVATGKQDCKCVLFKHDYCFQRTEVRGECICQRWLRVDYRGTIALTLEEWKDLFTRRLQSIECDYFGYELTESVVSSAGVVPKWIFFIYLHEPILRDEVISRLRCEDDSENVGDGLFAHYDCCSVYFLVWTIPFGRGNVRAHSSFASNVAFLANLVNDEMFSCFFYGLQRDPHFSLSGLKSLLSVSDRGEE